MVAQSRDSLLTEGLTGLFRLPLSTPEPDLLTRAINLAEAATHSRIGYIETMLRRADQALYLAKSRGGGLVIAGHEET